MDKPIIISFRWTAEEMLLAQRLHMRYSKTGRRFNRAIMGAGVFCVISGIVCFVQQHEFFMSALPFFLMAAFFFSIPLFRRQAVLKMFDQQPDRYMVITYEISADRIVSKSDMAATDMLWRTIARASRVPEGFLLYPGEKMFHWLPIRGFHDAAEVEQLAQLAKSNVPQYDDAIAE